MSRTLSIVSLLAVFLTSELAHGEACEFVDTPTTMTKALSQMNRQLDSILSMREKIGGDENPVCRPLAEKMSKLAASPKTYQEENQSQPTLEQATFQRELISVSTEFFRARCDRWVGENGTKALATTTLGIARSFLSTAALVPGFQLPVLAVGTLTDLVLGALEQLFKSRSDKDRLADQNKILDQQALLCTYFEHVTQIDETLNSKALDIKKERAQQLLRDQEKKLQELDSRIYACTTVSATPLGGGFIWEDWKKIKGKLEGENEAERYFSLLERIQSAEWNGEIAQALKRVCSPDETPNPTEQQKALCAYHRKLVDLLASPERDQTATLKAYENVIAGIGASRVFAGSELDALKAQLIVERALYDQLSLEARGLSDTDIVIRANIFDKIRILGKEMLSGTSPKGVLRTHIDTLQESIRSSVDRVEVSDLRQKLKRKTIACSDLSVMRDSVRTALAYSSFMENTCARFAGGRQAKFQDESLRFTNVDGNLEDYCKGQVRDANRKLNPVMTLKYELDNYGPTRDCPELRL